MPLLLETQSRTDALVVAMNHVLVTEGIPSLTLRHIARTSGVSPGSMLHHLGSKSHLLRVGAHRTGKALLLQVRAQQTLRGITAFLPTDADELWLARAWLAWTELARSGSMLERVIADIRRSERQLMAETVRSQYAEDDVVLALALVEGLRVAICAPLNPLPMPKAAALLHAQVTRSAA